MKAEDKNLLPVSYVMMPAIKVEFRVGPKAPPRFHRLCFIIKNLV